MRRFTPIDNGLGAENYCIAQISESGVPATENVPRGAVPGASFSRESRMDAVTGAYARVLVGFLQTSRYPLCLKSL